MILNDTQLQVRAREFALAHELALDDRQHVKFWPAFASDMAGLREFARQLSNRRARCTQPAEDWLLDHIAFVETQAQEVLRQLPRHMLHQLPKLKETGMPRVYAICEDYLTHVDGSYNVHSFETYLQAYQEVSILKVMEGWVMPTAMRVVIIRRLAQVMREVRERHDVCRSVTALLGEVGAKRMSDHKIRETLERKTRDAPLRPAEVVHLVQHLSEWEPDPRTVRDWLAAHVENGESSLSQMVSFEHEFQAELQVTSGHLVQSLHAVERHPWRATFIKISKVEQILLSEASGEYDQMDSSSRDLVRNHVCDIARQLGVPETLVAQTATRLANLSREHGVESSDPPQDGCKAYYVLDPDGIARLRKELAHVARPRRLPQVAIRRRPLSVYLASGAAFYVLLLIFTARALTMGLHLRTWGWLVVFAALLIPVSEWAVLLVHSAIRKCCKPAPLVRYDFSRRLPEDAKTMVVIPIIWSSYEEVDDVLGRLEVHYLANRQDNIHFAVLADFPDSERENEPGDEQLVAHAIEGVERLQKKYDPDRFFLFHRSRRYNQADGVYMGWERKRGKLVEFVEFISGSDTTSFSTVFGNTNLLREIRYVLTVDHDTQLPIGSVSRLAGTIHFPYNRPRLNSSGTRVVAGYGVLQPRISVSYESTQRSRFAALWAGEPGIDPYSFAISNPYQDLFGQAIFVGKGIFDVEVFRKTLVHRIPDNHVLSHDLLEGGFLRAGLTSDIEVVEEYPSTFLAYQRRAHRWIRGDWQLLKWLSRTCIDRFGINRPTDLCGLTRWQIVDNIRRSLVAPLLFLVFWLGQILLPGHPMGWLTVVLLTIFLPFLTNLFQGDWNRHKLRTLRISFFQNVVQLGTLPFNAVNVVDAIVRSLYRMLVSHKKLLEWVPAKQHRFRPDHQQVFAEGPTTYLLLGLLLVTSWLTGAFLIRVVVTVGVVMWGESRILIRYLNHPKKTGLHQFSAAAKSELTEIASQTWAYYDRYVTVEDSWLPPDNVQYIHNEVIAHRTSPTNIGLYLLSVVAAHDLGFISFDHMLQRLQDTVRTIQKMEKWEGHLYNWYDTKNLDPLTPRYVSTVDSGNFVSYLIVIRQALLEEAPRHAEVEDEVRGLSEELNRFIEDTNFSALYNPDDRLFCLGYDVAASRREVVLYDLLASEARQTSFVGIALGQIPASHWFTLARTMTLAGGKKTLLSWSGTMFEYLMPSLIMRAYPDTVWTETYRGVIHRQLEYARIHGVPFGISESGYYAFDHQFNYQYRAFGVPGLGFDRGLEQNLVVAPYAALLALPFVGEEGMRALAQYEGLGVRGNYGFYEAVDFTSVRLPQGSRYEVVQSFMAHHQGMSLLSLANVLLGNQMIRRFHCDARVKAADLLLQEKIPVKAALIEKPIGHNATLPEFHGHPPEAERIYRERTRVPQVNILSNGRFTSAMTNDGNGFLSWNGLAVTRWREDPVVDSSGVVLYVHDRESEVSYSVTRHPCQDVRESKTVFELDKTTFEGQFSGLFAKLEVTVPPNVDAEVRRLTLTNRTELDKTVEITSFLELTLAIQAADSAHPAFSKLFIQTSHDRDEQCLLAKRRPHDHNDQETWAVHTVYVDDLEAGDYEFETDRAVFIGRGHSLREPRGLWQHLKGTVGAVADPSFSMRRTVHLLPQQSVHVYAVTGVAPSRQAALQIVAQLRAPLQAEQAFHLAWVRAQIDLRHLHLAPAEAVVAHQLAGKLLYASEPSRVRREAIARNTLGQSALWRHGLSGDAPIATVVVHCLADLPFVTLLARQHQYLVQLGLAVDLVVLDETFNSYQDELMNRLRDSLAARGIMQMQRIVGLKAAHLSEAERTLLTAVSKVWLQASGPSLRAQLHALQDESTTGTTRLSGRPVLGERTTPPLNQGLLAAGKSDRDKGEFFNGWGSFVDQGKAYQIHVKAGAYLPRPWTNVLANPSFGCLMTELGTGYTWARNSREFKLTPWSNDPVLDPPGECLYLSNLDSKEIWTATPKPAGGERLYSITHGFGFTRIEQFEGPVAHTMETLVPLSDPLKVVRLTLRNPSTQSQRLGVTYYAHWVLGVNEEGKAPFLVTEWDEASQTLLATNRYQESFRDRVAFLHISSSQQRGQSESSLPTHLQASRRVHFTCDGEEFLGRPGAVEQPAALVSGELSERVGVLAKPCGVVQIQVELAPGGAETILILLGSTTTKAETRSLVTKYDNEGAYQQAFCEVEDYWKRETNQVQVTTPDRAMDIMLNGWLLYQALACRLWARTAFYQAGGAFGFRDQLQDSLAFLHSDPTLTRRQILYSAAHQYEEGDVQHWWHEETKKGIRTRFSDDLLWLPYAVARYLKQTGDMEILNEVVHFLHSEVLNQDELERYEDTVVSDEKGTLWDHCVRAIGHASRFGEHGLPLIGVGDWNDGLNRIGDKGRGESVWLGWFLLEVLKRFSGLAKEMQDGGHERVQSPSTHKSAQADDFAVAAEFEQAANTLQHNLNEYAWDGAWFRRAFTDAGAWLGSIEDRECRIDAIAQSWSVISDGASEERQERAMRAFDRELVDRDLGLARLLTQAFDEMKPQVGYIQGYPPGIRENGGQYTHGVIWSIIAWALLGRRDKAFELFALLNPISHTQTMHEVLTYGNEPYVMTADVYTASPHQGFGGWSWYTGAAGWMYQAGLEYVLGVTRRKDRLYVRPCVPQEWDAFQVTYRYGETTYVIDVDCSQSTNEAFSEWIVDGQERSNLPYLQLVDDGQTHGVQVRAARRDISTFG